MSSQAISLYPSMLLRAELAQVLYKASKLTLNVQGGKSCVRRLHSITGGAHVLSLIAFPSNREGRVDLGLIRHSFPRNSWRRPPVSVTNQSHVATLCDDLFWGDEGYIRCSCNAFQKLRYKLLSHKNNAQAKVLLAVMHKLTNKAF